MGFRFDDDAVPTPARAQDLAQAAADAHRILLPLRCACGKETLASISAFANPDILLDSMLDQLGWTFRSSYIVKLDHAVLRPVCPVCTADTKKDHDGPPIS